ncbi:hypothetical protein FJ981_27985 [Mesorhizobium sp. B1-1-4]|uniref:hypothetical protein n=1 Tax=Mesorhizobium sp. B1-1-4 TaxID=2589980 RepID=UPI001126CA1E|nr:hypothetical protein [Mesorhizobium sp. B1-1-4]TPN44439.1 hypothetical protein FJ981_27985 [Mesorhizobium sp. B1-1-4]
MTGDFLPEFKIVPAKGGGYLASYRLFDGVPFKLIPGDVKATAGQALNAAKDYVRQKLNPPIRREIAAKDVLGVQQWHEARAARQAEQQEQALGAIIVKGKQVKVERRRA